jgi:hypothetical protein
MNNEGQVPFEQTWCFPSEMKKTLQASWYEVLPTPFTYASGREKFLARFYGPGYGANRPIVAVRDAMELTSKKTGRPYHVCRREPTVEKTTPLKAAARTARYTAEDVLADA